jgi:hypothetical protein
VYRGFFVLSENGKRRSLLAFHVVVTWILL